VSAARIAKKSDYLSYVCEARPKCRGRMGMRLVVFKDAAT